ncbi:MAG: carboxymuconolactone decarboxylase family protein [Sediminibacterium sp.]|nr:carboxymuconolactone decarboxylase family protein [Sediminibacterium sp.]
METTTQNETLAGLLVAAGLNGSPISKGLNHLSETDHRYLKDLKINVSNALGFSALNPKERFLLALAVAINDKHPELTTGMEALALENGAGKQDIAETYACVSLLNVNNVFYRFRHFTKKEFYTTTPAGIKMSSMGNPVLGKEFFELMSLAVSALNGCELCVNAHEASLIKMGTSEQRIYDAIRLSAIFRGLCSIA